MRRRGFGGHPCPSRVPRIRTSSVSPGPGHPGATDLDTRMRDDSGRIHDEIGKEGLLADFARRAQEASQDLVVDIGE